MTDNEEEVETNPEINEDGEHHAESWQEELPPDDFHDHDEAQEEPEETETVESEETHAESNPFEGASQQKRGTAIFYVILAGIVVLIGGLVYLQFGGGNQQKGPAAIPANVLASNALTTEKTPKTTEPNIAGQPIAPTTPTTSETDISAIYNAGLTKTTTPTASNVALPGESAPDHTADKTAASQAIISDVVTTTPAAQPQSATSPQTAVDKPLMPSVEPPKTESVVPRTTGVALPAVSSAPAQGVMETNTEARLKELSDQINDLKKMIQETSQQTSQLAMKVENIQAPQASQTPQTPPTTNTALEGRLDQIEQKMSQLTNSKAAKTAGIEVHEKAETEYTPSTLIENVTAPAKQTVKKAPKPAPKKRVKQAESHKETTGKWILRAATPDAAWVSKGAGSTELRQVQIGDNVSGIGKVREIRQNGDGWMVIGTKGTIR